MYKSLLKQINFILNWHLENLRISDLSNLRYAWMLNAQFVWFNRKYIPTLRSMRMHINEQIDVKLALIDDNSLN